MIPAHEDGRPSPKPTGATPPASLRASAGPGICGRGGSRAESPFVTVGLICAALLAMVLIFVLVSWSLARLMHIEDVSLLAKAGDLLAIVGWMIGLVVSGFPNVLRSGAERTATDAAAGG